MSEAIHQMGEVGLAMQEAFNPENGMYELMGDALRDIANIYPELLSNATITEEGIL